MRSMLWDRSNLRLQELFDMKFTNIVYDDIAGIKSEILLDNSKFMITEYVYINSINNKKAYVYEIIIPHDDCYECDLLFCDEKINNAVDMCYYYENTLKKRNLMDQ